MQREIASDLSFDPVDAVKEYFTVIADDATEQIRIRNDKIAELEKEIIQLSKIRISADLGFKKLNNKEVA